MDPHLEVYDGGAGINTQDTQAGYQALNEEVAQLTSSLGRLWGGFRKQALSTVESARKLDLASVAVKAQQDLASAASRASSELRDLQEALTYPAAASPASTSADEAATTPTATGESATTGVSEKDPTPATDEPTTPTQSTAPLPTSPTSPTSTFFARLQASLPPNIAAAVQATLPELERAQASLVSTVQATLPEQLKQADLAQLRDNLTKEFTRVQGLTRAQAEEYVQRTDGLLREAVQGAGDFLKDAVRVVPPAQGGAAPAAGAGAALDGSDLWMMDRARGAGVADDKGKGKEAGAPGAAAFASPQDAQRAVATRAQALLRRLRHDPAVLRADPAAEADLDGGYAAWVAREVASRTGGIKSPEWTERIVDALEDDADGDALNDTMDALVPDAMTKTEFWTRYFFREHQVLQEEARRKALLQTSAEKDEEVFSWEDDDEEKAASPIAKTAPAPLTTVPAAPSAESTPEPPAVKAPPPAKASVPTAPAESATSPRHSSESSYDVVSSNVSTSGDAKEESDDDDEDEDEEEDDSDWE